MERILNYTISAADEGMIVLDFLRKQGFSRHILTAMKADREALSLNGQKAGGRTVLSCGDHFRVRLLETVPTDGILPTPLNIPVLYEDEDILVLNKPADTPIHPSMGNYENTLANGVAHYYQSQGISFVYRCINRLDRDTTGALILAKHAYSAALLSAAMQRREIHRTYLALVQGLCPEYGVIDAPIARKDASVIEREVNLRTGAPALTRYECLAFHQGLSLVQLRLETGRTHQIRVHISRLSSAGRLFI